MSASEEMDEGLFGQVFLFIFEILPYLDRHGVKPSWDIHAQRYGGATQSVIPGVLELAYRPEQASRDVPLSLIRDRHCSQLGNDWEKLNRLWTSYFRIPDTIQARAEAFGPLGDTLGVHYRGTDKQTASWDTNPVTAEDMISLITDFRRRRPDLTKVFLATDDKVFAERLPQAIGCEVLNLGEVYFHKRLDHVSADLEDAKRALLDSVMLSRCGAALKTSSALSAFAKIFNPDLEIYRCAASKRFTDIPYFPVAYIPPYQSNDPAVRVILERLMRDDWQQSDTTALEPFTARPRHRRRSLKWRAIEALMGSPVR